MKTTVTPGGGTASPGTPTLLTPAQWMAAATPPVWKTGYTGPPVLISAPAQSTAFWAQWPRFGGRVQVKCLRPDGHDLDGAIPTAQSYLLACYARDHGLNVVVEPNRLLQDENYMWSLAADTWVPGQPGYGTSTTTPAHATRTPGCWSPAMDNSVYGQAGLDMGAHVTLLRNLVTAGGGDIEAILHDGEESLGVASAINPAASGTDLSKWSADPDCLALFSGPPTEALLSLRRAALYEAQFDGLRAAAPNADLLVYYRMCHPELYGYAVSEIWKNALFRWTDARTLLLDGYRYGNPDLYIRSGTDPWGGTYGLWNKATCTAGGTYVAGDALMPYVSGGYQQQAFAPIDITRYRGWLIMLGLLGARSYVCFHNATEPSTYYNATSATEPNYLQQYQAAAEAAAVTSHWWALYPTLLPGAAHPFAAGQTNCEAVTSDAGVKAVIRQRAGGAADYLVGVWATTGSNRYVLVTTPLGQKNLYARTDAMLYRVNTLGVQQLTPSTATSQSAGAAAAVWA